MNKVPQQDRKTQFVAVNVIKTIDDQHFVYLSGPNSEAVAQFTVNEETATQLCNALGISLITVKKSKQWLEEDQENAAEGNADVHQLNASTTLQEEAPVYE